MIAKRDSLGDRMKGMYESAFRHTLPGRIPIIIRVDGRAFHSFTKHCERPFDPRLMNDMDATAMALCKEIQGAQIAYVQSDEISVLIHPYKRLQSQCWFDGDIQKMVSISASVATAAFNYVSRDRDYRAPTTQANFDSRVFVLPENDVCNYFLWRQKDMERNSVQMLARSLYSHNECEDKNGSELQEMCFQKGQNWNDLPTCCKRGRCIVKAAATAADGQPQRWSWIVDDEIPIFSQDRNYIERFLTVEPEESAGDLA